MTPFGSSLTQQPISWPFTLKPPLSFFLVFYNIPKFVEVLNFSLKAFNNKKHIMCPSLGKNKKVPSRNTHFLITIRAGFRSKISSTGVRRSILYAPLPLSLAGKHCDPPWIPLRHQPSNPGNSAKVRFGCVFLS